MPSPIDTDLPMRDKGLAQLHYLRLIAVLLHELLLRTTAVPPVALTPPMRARIEALFDQAEQSLR